MIRCRVFVCVCITQNLKMQSHITSKSLNTQPLQPQAVKSHRPSEKIDHPNSQMACDPKFYNGIWTPHHRPTNLTGHPIIEGVCVWGGGGVRKTLCTYIHRQNNTLTPTASVKSWTAENFPTTLTQRDTTHLRSPAVQKSSIYPSECSKRLCWASGKTW